MQMQVMKISGIATVQQKIKTTISPFFYYMP
jgi:hypothetical protein